MIPEQHRCFALLFSMNLVVVNFSNHKVLHCLRFSSDFSLSKTYIYIYIYIYTYYIYIYVYCQIDTGSLFTSNPNPSWNPVQQCKLLFCPMRSHDLQSVQRTHSWPQLYPLSVTDSAIAQANPSLQPRGCGNNWFLEEPPG